MGPEQHFYDQWSRTWRVWLWSETRVWLPECLICPHPSVDRVPEEECRGSATCEHEAPRRLARGRGRVQGPCFSFQTQSTGVRGSGAGWSPSTWKTVAEVRLTRPPFTEGMGCSINPCVIKECVCKATGWSSLSRDSRGSRGALQEDLREFVPEGAPGCSAWVPGAHPSSPLGAFQQSYTPAHVLFHSHKVDQGRIYDQGYKVITAKRLFRWVQVEVSEEFRSSRPPGISWQLIILPGC